MGAAADVLRAAAAVPGAAATTAADATAVVILFPVGRRHIIGSAIGARVRDGGRRSVLTMTLCSRVMLVVLSHIASNTAI